MSGYHINPETGRAGKCNASKRPCPHGTPEEHYASKDEAEVVYQARLAQNNSAFSTHTQGGIAATEYSPYMSGYRSSGAPLTFEASEYTTTKYVNEEGRLYSLFNKGQDREGKKFIVMAPLFADGKPDLENREYFYLAPGDANSTVPGFNEVLRDRRLVESELQANLNSPGRNNYGRSMDEMIRHNIGEREKELRAELAAMDVEGEPEPSASPKDLRIEELQAEIKQLSQAPHGTEEAALVRRKLAAKRQELSGLTQAIGANTPKLVGNRSTTWVHGDYQFEKAAIARMPGYGKTPDITVVMPHAQKLTKRRLLALGEELWSLAGRDPEKWSEASEEGRLQFVGSKVQLAKNVKVNVTPKGALLTHRGGGSSLANENFLFMQG